jgi:hypothetical protein
MSGVASASTHPSVGQQICRVLAIVLVFALIGPPAGAFFFLMMTALIGMGGNADLAGMTWIGFFALIYGIPFGYLIGIVPAILAGLLIGVPQVFYRQTPWWFAVVAGALTGIAFQIGTGQPLIPQGDDIVKLYGHGPAMIVTCIVSTLICWLVVRSWYWARAQAGAEA